LARRRDVNGLTYGEDYLAAAALNLSPHASEDPATYVGVA